MMTLAGKTAVITGGAQGIGAACAKQLAEHGAHIGLMDIAGETLNATAKRLADETGKQVETEVVDLSDAAASLKAFDALAARLGGVDILINNAAILAAGDIFDLELTDFDRVMGINLRPAFVLGQAAVRHMRDTKREGSVINMSSVNAQLAIPNQLAYVTAKGALSQLTSVMALACAPHNIRVNAIGPGSIATDMLKQVMTDEKARQAILARTPMGRPGEPDEIGRLAVFLASDYASYITGQTIFADGGRLPLNYTMPVN
jgi:Dehydrogenases with different specificities (related to short-chain alcohol dehydrogenases)